MTKVFFWGAGRFVDAVKNNFFKLKGYHLDEWCGFLDNNSDLWGKRLLDLPVYAPAQDKIDEAELFVISTTFVDEIKRQLINEYGVKRDHILSFVEYERYCYTRHQHKKKYPDNIESNNVFKTKKIVIYTCITGEYDELKDPYYVSPDITYVCFTNNNKIKSRVWNVERITNGNLDNVHLARKMKLFPDQVFHDFETSIWVDGKYQIKEDLREYIKIYGKETPILCFPHSRRDCIYDELEECVKCGKGIPEDMKRQCLDYRRKGYEQNNGLYDTGCIVRNHHDQRIKQLCHDWWDEIVRYSYRDQLSFPYICKKNNIFPDICDLDISRNIWLEAVSHHGVGV